MVSAEDMASSMKLLAVRAIDSLLDYPQGVESFLGWSTKVCVCTVNDIYYKPIMYYKPTPSSI